MPRERAFDTAETLTRATDVFAEHGFRGTSLAMLTEATGLGRQSLYNAFGDKQHLYLQALDDAVARAGIPLAAMVAAANGREALSVFFDALLQRCISPEPAHRRCIVSCGLLEGLDEPRVSGALREKWQASHELLRAQVERGQKDGSIRSAEPSASLADLLMSQMSGLRVSAAAGMSAPRLRRQAELALAVLDLPAPEPHAQAPPRRR